MARGRSLPASFLDAGQTAIGILAARFAVTRL